MTVKGDEIAEQYAGNRLHFKLHFHCRHLLFLNM